MIVCPYDEERVTLLAQTDHSHVAGVLAAHWGNEHFARLAPYNSMVLAAQEHDSGWWDWEIRPTLGADGRPMDYIGSTKRLGDVWLDFYRKGVERVAAHDLYAAFNISAHGEGLATKGMGLLPGMPDLTPEPGFGEYVEEQKTWRAGVLEKFRKDPALAEYASDEHIWTNYNYMQVFDQFSQFITNRHPFNSTVRKNGPTPTLSDIPIPTKPGKDPVVITIDVLDETAATVDPYPFDVDPLVIHFQGRLIPNRPFESEQEFLEAYYRAEMIPITRVLQSK
jgi:hypothetical protein